MQKRQNLPIVCGTLVVINVIVYLICTFTGDLLYNIGELDAVAVLRYGEYGRILSSTFLHAGIEHIFNNMVILFFLGAMIEKVTGHLQFLILYLLSGIGANICSLIYKVIAMERIASVWGERCDFRLGRSVVGMDFTGSEIYAGCYTQTSNTDDRVISL